MIFFFKRVIKFGFLPFFFLGVIDAFLPVTFFTYRHFEGVLFDTHVPHIGKMYPNIVSSMNAVGDLCHHTDKAIYKKEFWKTDSIGFRNDKFISDPDIIFIGDSFIQGSSLSQNQIITNKIKDKFHDSLKIYNMSPATMSDFNEYFNLGILKKPKIIVFSIVERDVPNSIVFHKNNFYSKAQYTLKKIFSFRNINVYLDKMFRRFSLEWLKSRINRVKGKGIPSVGNSKMFFLNGISQSYDKKNYTKQQKILYPTKNIVIL